MGRRTRNLQAGVFVHGFDIPLTDPSSYERAARRNAETLRSVGVELISVATNYRGLHTDWRDSHGAALASCLALWAGHFDTGLIAASGPYDVPALRWGSTPVADRLLSSRGFEIAHDGADLTRLDRARILGEWPEALRNLRVCWEGDPPDVNCCSCEKCIRTILEFRTVGLKLPSCFPRDVTGCADPADKTPRSQCGSSVTAGGGCRPSLRVRTGLVGGGPGGKPGTLCLHRWPQQLPRLVSLGPLS